MSAAPSIALALPAGAGKPVPASVHQRVHSAPPTPDEYKRMQWAFAYGSLIWNPEFEFEERHKVRIDGYHRAFCINSHTYRGTPEHPGVVLGLDEGGSCEGIAYRVKAGDEARGPALERAGDLAAMLSNLMEGDVLFIDEIHRMARPAEELLYMAMEDFRIDVIVGKGPGATSIPLELAPFTLVGATTRSGMLTGPLRDRFGFTAQMEFYDTTELTKVVTRAAKIIGVGIDPDAAVEIASRSRGTPRIANRLLRRVRDYAEVHSHGHIDVAAARAALIVFDVDEKGLDRLDRAVLEALVKTYGGGPVGVSTLAVAVGEEPSTVEEVCEPYLVRAGMIARTGRGRVATASAWEHLELTPPPDAMGIR